MSDEKGKTELQQVVDLLVEMWNARAMGRYSEVNRQLGALQKKIQKALRCPKHRCPTCKSRRVDEARFRCWNMKHKWYRCLECDCTFRPRRFRRAKIWKRGAGDRPTLSGPAQDV